MYLSHRSLRSTRFLSGQQRKQIFREYWFKAYKTRYPYLGLALSLTFYSMLNYYFAPYMGAIQAAFTLALGWLAYFQFHCYGIESLLRHKNELFI